MMQPMHYATGPPIKREVYYNNNNGVGIVSGVTKILLVVMSVWLGFFLVTRVAHLVQSYKLETIRQTDHVAFSDICLSHPELRRLRAAECNQALMLAESSVIWSTLFRVFEQTHTCGTMPCTDIVLVAIDKTSGLVFYFVLACASALLMYAVFSRIVQPLAVSAVRPHIDYSDARTQNIESAHVAYAYGRSPCIEEVQD